MKHFQHISVEDNANTQKEGQDIKQDLGGAFARLLFGLWMASTSKLQIYRRPLKADEIVSRGRTRLDPASLRWQMLSI